MDESEEDWSEGSIVSYDSLESDDDDFSYDSLESDDDDFSYSETSSSEESVNAVVDIPDDYSPEGVDSDDDSGNCCHWCRTQSNHKKINLNAGITPCGSPDVVLPDDYTTPADLAERVLDNNFIDHIINCTNIIRIYFGLVRIPSVHYAWSTDPLKRIPEIPKVMSIVSILWSESTLELLTQNICQIARMLTATLY